jgi:hypothetical protein
MGKSHQAGWVSIRGKYWYGYYRVTVLDPETNVERVKKIPIRLGLKTQLSKLKARNVLRELKTPKNLRPKDKRVLSWEQLWSQQKTVSPGSDLQDGSEPISGCARKEHSLATAIHSCASPKPATPTYEKYWSNVRSTSSAPSHPILLFESGGWLWPGAAVRVASEEPS